MNHNNYYYDAGSIILLQHNMRAPSQVVGGIDS